MFVNDAVKNEYRHSYFSLVSIYTIIWSRGFFLNVSNKIIKLWCFITDLINIPLLLHSVAGPPPEGECSSVTAAALQSHVPNWPQTKSPRHPPCSQTRGLTFTVYLPSYVLTRMYRLEKMVQSLTFQLLNSWYAGHWCLVLLIICTTAS